MPAPKNEKVIFDDLVRWANEAVKKVYEIWKRKRQVDPFFLSWPATVVKAYDGTSVNDVCRMELPENRAVWPRMFREALKLTNPFAVLLCEQRERDIHLIIESEYGTISWTIPIQRRGDISVLGQPTKKTDVECIGLLWRKSLVAQA